MKIIRLQVLLAVLFLLLLAGCEEKVTLFNENHTPIGDAVFDFSGNYDGIAKFVIDHKEFKGPWSVVKTYEEETAKRHKLIGWRSYEEYMQGDSTDQLKHGHATLTDRSGSELVCDFDYRIEPGAGQCSLDGKRLVLVMGHPTL